MKTLDIIGGLLIVAPVLWIAWTAYWFPLPRGRGPISLFIDAVVRDSIKRNK